MPSTGRYDSDKKGYQYPAIPVDFCGQPFAFRHCFALQFFAKGRVFPDTTPWRPPIIMA